MTWLRPFGVYFRSWALAILIASYAGLSTNSSAQAIGSGLNAIEGTSISTVSTPQQSDTLWADSGNHRWEMSNTYLNGLIVASWPCGGNQGCIPYAGTLQGSIYAETPLLFGATTGAPLLQGTSAPQWGSVDLRNVTALSNASGTKLATAATTVPTTGNLASWDANKNVADSGTSPCLIQNANAGFLVPPYFFLPSAVGSGSALASSANGVKFVQFYLPCKTTLNHVSAYISTASAGQSAVFGLYSCGQSACTNTSPLVTGSSVALSCATINVVVTGNTSSQLTLLPGIYAFAYGATDTTCAVTGQGSANWMAILNQNSSKRMAPAGNTISGTTMPGTLGTIGTPAAQAIPFTLWEP